MGRPSEARPLAYSRRPCQGGDADLSQLPFLYGTAWKEAATTDLVVKAVRTGVTSSDAGGQMRLGGINLKCRARAGFRGIDTACQPKHYRNQVAPGLSKYCKGECACNVMHNLLDRADRTPGEDLVGAALAKLAADPWVDDRVMLAQRAWHGTRTVSSVWRQSHTQEEQLPREALWIQTKSRGGI